MKSPPFLLRWSIDEMYQVLSYLPDEVAYNCRKCLPVHPAPWEQTIRREIHAGIAAVIGTMVVSKSITHLHTLVCTF